MCSGADSPRRFTRYTVPEVRTIIHIFHGVNFLINNVMTNGNVCVCMHIILIVRGKTPRQMLAPRLLETTGPDRKLKARVEEAVSIGASGSLSAISWSVL